jgi:lysophospholipase L1-like esterase
MTAKSNLFLAIVMAIALGAIAISPRPIQAQTTQPSAAAPRPARGGGGGAARGARGPQSMSPRDARPFTVGDYKSLNPNLPTLIIAGDSTAATGDPDHRGWAAVLIDYFDTSKINVVNLARGGRSSRTFVHEGLWDQLLTGVKPGDWVMIQFGHNDGGDINAANGRPDLKGIGDETQTVTRADGTTEVVHSFGWYTKKFVKDVRDKGANPVIMSATPYDRWTNGRFTQQRGDFGPEAKQIADLEKVPFMNHTQICADRYDQFGETIGREMFNTDSIHSHTLGAIVNAECFVAGVKGLQIKVLTDALNAKAAAIPACKPEEVTP